MAASSNNRTDEESHQVHDQLGTAPLPGPPASSLDKCCSALSDRRVQSYICVVVTVTILVAMVPLVVTLTSRARMHSHHHVGAPAQASSGFEEQASASTKFGDNDVEEDIIPVPDAETRFDHVLNTLYGVSTLEALTSGTSAQNRALTWIADFDKAEIPLTDEKRLVQRYVLALLFFSTGGGEGIWFKDLNFLSETHECEWSDIDIFHIKKGVLECDGDGYVTKLDLHHNRLEGTLASEIGALSRLHTVYLSANSLEGQIPPELGKLTELHALYLPGNGFTGSIPHHLSLLTNMEFLNFSRNKLSGTVPEEFVNMGDISFVYLEANDLTGSLDFLCDAWTDLSQIKVDLDTVTCSCCTCCE